MYPEACKGPARSWPSPSSTLLLIVSHTNRAAGICNLFEKRLIEQLPSVHNITYGTEDLLEFLDSLVDITALVLDPSTLKYTPFDRQWIKQRALEHLQMQSRPNR
eukprot:SM000161S02412  [mRNA]  locus=s161:1606:2123:+ [translate_table: standard]